MIRRLGALALALVLMLSQTVAPAWALVTDGRADSWTRDKAAHLGSRVYYAATAADIDRLFAAGSARAAVDVVFPDATGPDRTAFDAEMAALTAEPGFAYNNTSSMRVYYQMRYGRDPYEAKAKLFSLFEDIFALNEYSDKIDYPDVIRHYELVYRHTLGNYRTMVKRVLYNDGNPGDYAMGTFLTLLNGADPSNPNENYGRELLQLFLMGEYLPGDSKDSGSPRNYSEADVAAFARILTGFRSDDAHVVSYDPSKHNRSTGVAFLTGALASGASFPFHDVATDTLDIGAMDQSVMGNDGLADNAIDYVFAKRERAIALFLANKLFRFYIHESPTRADLDPVADSIIAERFEILPVVRALLASDAMYSDRAMNTVRYKNPLEMVFGTAKLLHAGGPDVADPLLRRPDALSSLAWNPYNADSIFGRDGFDANFKFMTAYVYNQWLTYATRIANTTGTGTYSLDEVFAGRTVAVGRGSVFASGTGLAYTGALTLGTGSVSYEPVASPMRALSAPIEEAGAVDTATGESASVESVSDSGAIAPESTPSVSDAMTGDTATGSIAESIVPVETPVMLEAPASVAPAMESMPIEMIAPAETPATLPTEASMPETAPIEPVVEMPAAAPAEMLMPEVLPPPAPVEPAPMPMESAPAPTESAPAPVDTPPVGEPMSWLDWLVPTARAEEAEMIPVSETAPTEPTPMPPVEMPAIESMPATEPVQMPAVMSEAPMDVMPVSELAPVSPEIISIPEASSEIVSPSEGSEPTGTPMAAPSALRREVVSDESAAIAPLAAPGDATTLTGARLRLSDMRVLVSGSGTLTVFSGSLAADTDTLMVHSGSLAYSGSVLPVYAASFPVLSGSLARERTADELIDALASRLLPSRPLPPDVRAGFVRYLSTDNSGATILPHPAVGSYATSRLRGLVALMLSQPEYVLVSGYDIPAAPPESTGSSPVSSARGKLVIVQLFGGYDWLHGMIPKSDYDRVAELRTTDTNGTIVTDRSRLIDLGDYYMSDSFSAFAPFATSGNLKIFNGVGGSWHSRDHDAAQRQISSYSDVTDMYDDGVVGHLIRSERDSSKAIALDAGSPNVYRSGNFISIGANGAQIRNADGGVATADRERYVAELRTIVSSRAYPGDSASVFRDAIKINDVAAASKARGGRDGAGYSLAERFAFLRDLVDSDVGEIYYVNGEGGYDTHSNQVKRTGETSRDLDTLLANVSTETAKFFSSVKDNHDITVIIFSEFGRTIRVNGDRGTDHGEGGGMFMLTSNPDIRTALPRTTYGYGSATKSSENWLGVGIDYRSVYGVIYRALYGLDPSAFFGDSVSIDRDVSLASARIGRVETRYEPLSTTRARVRLSADIAGDNLDLDKAGYVQYGTATDTGVISMQSPYATRTRAMSGSMISFTRDINAGQSMAYRVDAVTNQYVTSTLSGSVAAPRIVATPASRPTGTGATPGPTIDALGDSILYAHRNTAVNGEVTLAGSGITLYDSGSGATTRTFTGRGGVEWSTGTGFTGVSALFGTGLTWQGGFTLGEGYTGTGFFGTGSLSAGSLAIPASAVSRVAKIGADTPGVGLRLTQSVRVTLSGSPGTSYRVYRSEDGRSWEDITGSGAVIADQAGRVSFGTDRFSYFAIVPATPVCTLSASETTVAAGASVTLSYLTANASSAQIAPYVGMVAPLAASGSVSVTVPSGTTEYIMTLDNNAAYSCRVSVTGMGGSGGGGGGSGGGSGGGGGSSPSTPDSSASSGGGGGGSGGLPSSDAGYRQRTSANATTVVGRPRAVRSDSASGVTMRPADGADMEASAESGAPVGLSDEDARTAEDILARALGIADMPESSLSRMRLRQDLVERVERSIARTVASGPDSERATRLLRIAVALDRIAADLPSGSNLERTVRSVRSRTLEKFPEAAETVGPMADSIRDSADSSPLLPDSSLRMPPAVVPAESRRTGRVVRR